MTRNSHHWLNVGPLCLNRARVVKQDKSFDIDIYLVIEPGQFVPSLFWCCYSRIGIWCFRISTMWYVNTGLDCFFDTTKMASSGFADASPRSYLILRPSFAHQFQQTNIGIAYPSDLGQNSNPEPIDQGWRTSSVRAPHCGVCMTSS